MLSTFQVLLYSLSWISKNNSAKFIVFDGWKIKEKLSLARVTASKGQGWDSNPQLPLADFQRPHLLFPYSTIFQFCNLDCLSIPKALNCCLNIFILDTRLAVVIPFHSPPLRYPLQIRGRDNVSKEQLTPRKKTPKVIDTNHGVLLPETIYKSLTSIAFILG